MKKIYEVVGHLGKQQMLVSPSLLQMKYNVWVLGEYKNKKVQQVNIKWVLKKISILKARTHTHVFNDY